jgi:hypothetical protein
MTIGKKLHIYLDTRDLIVLAERQSDEYFKSIGEWLDCSQSNLVFSLSNILECCIPLSSRLGQTSVMRTLGKLEDLPHAFLAEAKIHRDELVSAINSYLKNEDYQHIDPYVARFDEVLSPFQPPATAIYMKYGLAQAVFEVWQEMPDLFSADDHSSQLLASSRKYDRALPNFRRHEPNFAEYIHRTLQQFSINFPNDELKSLADWILKQSTRCPSIRFGYEVYHQILKNVTDISEDSDIGDLTHVGCLPYIDAMTLDRRMRGYVAQADRALGTQYSKKVFADLQELQSQLCTTS